MISNAIEVEITGAVSYQNGPAWNYPVNHYPYNSLYCILGGNGHVKIGEEQTDLLPGRVYLIPADTLFSCWCDTHIQKVYIDVQAQIVPGYDVFASQSAVLCAFCPIEKIARLVSFIEDSSLKNDLLLRAEVTGMIANFLPEDFLPESLGILSFKPLLDDISANLSASLKIGDIAARSGQNASVLSRKFRAKTGQTLKSYVQKLLLDKVKKELLTTDKSLKEIAAEYDFCDPYYLSDFFKRQVGISPNIYRKNAPALRERSASKS